MEIPRKVTVTFHVDTLKLFDMLKGANGSVLGERLVDALLLGGITGFREDLGLASYGITIATPKPEGDTNEPA